MRVSVLINSRLRRKGALKGIDKLTPEANVAYTEYKGHAIDIAKDFIPKSDFMIVIGGDGTFNEFMQVAGHLVDTGQRVPKVALISAGSANDFSRNISLAQNIEEALDWVNSSSRQVDFGRIKIRSQVKYFINIADFGLGAAVVKLINSNKRKLNPDLAFLWATSRAFFKYKPYTVKLKTSDFEREERVAAIAVANGKCFGSGLYIAPEASIDSGIFQLTTIGNLGRLDYLLNVLKLKKIKRLSHPKVRYENADWVEIEAIESRGELEADGEHFGFGKVRIEIVPKGLTIVAN